jgi:uncharacterized protein YgbK (DUF1537 family)
VNRLRLLADDLTGALDGAARFVPAAGPVPVIWRPPPRDLPFPAAIDSATRDVEEADARRMLDRLAVVLEDAAPAFKKIDSLLRGHTAVEIARCARGFDHCVIAPAFPFQGRATIGGRQMRRDARGWIDVGVDLAGGLRRESIVVVPRRPGETVPEGASLWDAETDADLDQVIAAGREAQGRVLWCGTAGLAGALAGHGSVSPPELRRPILALVGSDHQVSIAQLSVAWKHVHRIRGGGPEEMAPIARRLARTSAAVAVVVPPEASRATASAHVARCFAALLAELDPPGTLFAAGGETLRTACETLGASRLEVDGELVPGVPTSIMCGGRWDGLRVVSKSGAFGDSGFLARLLAPPRDGAPI